MSGPYPIYMLGGPVLCDIGVLFVSDPECLWWVLHVCASMCCISLFIFGYYQILQIVLMCDAIVRFVEVEK